MIVGHFVEGSVEYEGKGVAELNGIIQSAVAAAHVLRQFVRIISYTFVVAAYVVHLQAIARVYRAELVFHAVFVPRYGKIGCLRIYGRGSYGVTVCGVEFAHRRAYFVQFGHSVPFVGFVVVTLPTDLTEADQAIRYSLSTANAVPPEVKLRAASPNIPNIQTQNMTILSVVAGTSLPLLPSLGYTSMKKRNDPAIPAAAKTGKAVISTNVNLEKEYAVNKK